MRKAGQGRLDRPMLLDGHRRPRLTFRKEAAGPAAPNEHRPVYGVPSGTIRQRALNLPPLCQRALALLPQIIDRIGLVPSDLFTA
jgi:hypothetical protein